MPLVPIYTPGWRETTWSQVSCLRKQHDSRDQAQTTNLQVESLMWPLDHPTSTVQPQDSVNNNRFQISGRCLILIKPLLLLKMFEDNDTKFCFFIIFFRNKSQEATLPGKKQSFWDWNDQESGRKILIRWRLWVEELLARWDREHFASYPGVGGNCWN